MSKDRLTDDYEPRFDLDFERGRQAEVFVADIVAGLQTEAVEVKRDDESQETGNIYLEYRCLRQGEYKPSGLATTDADYWVFVVDMGDLAICVSTDRLKQLGRKAYSEGRVAECTRGSHPTKGVVVSLHDVARSGTKAMRTTLLDRYSDSSTVNGG